MKTIKVVWNILGVIYFPVYIFFWLLHKIVRFLLAICYFGMLKKQIASDIISSLFK